MRYALRILCLCLLLLGFGHHRALAAEAAQGPPQQSYRPRPVPAHEHREHEHPADASTSETEVGVDEHLGERIPLDILFVDEQARELRLGEVVTKPTLLLPVYYSCPTVCTTMLANLAGAINRTPLKLGDDYKVISLSFDEEEGPEVALRAKNNYTKILKDGLPREAWSFLTGDKESIRALTDAIGFKFKRTDQNLFVHPNVLIALAPDGTVIRYLYGPSFLPFDIGMALTEAAKGTPGLSVRKLLTYCFAYDSQSQRYIFRSFRLMAAGILLLLLAFFFLVLRKGNRTS